MPQNSSPRNRGGFFLTSLLILAAVLACSSGSAKKCTATLTYEGKTFTGEDASGDKATRFACNKYCREADPGYEAMYGIWLDSPAGKAAGRPSKEEAIFKDKKVDGLCDGHLRERMSREDQRRKGQSRNEM